MKKLAVAVVIFLMIFITGNAQERKIDNESVVHLSHVTGNTYIQKAAEIEYEEGVVNMPISEGDRVGTTDGRAEIFLGLGNYIRLDKNTKIDFEKFPQQENRIFQFRVWAGNIYLSIQDLENEKDIEIHTSDVSIYLLDAGLYRIDVRADAETEIFVFNGLVEAAGESGSVLIKDEQRLEAAEGYFTSHPTSFFAASNDSFDRWSENRDSFLKQHLAKSYLPERPDLSWSFYNYSRWDWSPLYSWSPFYSWYWIPRFGWGSGWNSWYWRPNYFGWSHMSYWGYYGFGNRYYGGFRGQPYPYNSGSLTVIRKNQLKARSVYQVSLSQDSIFTSTRSPVDIQKLDQNKFSLKNKVNLTSKPTIKKFKSYPSSRAITAKKYSSSKSSKKPSSAISRIYQRISKRSGSVSQGSSRGSTSRSTISRTGSSSSRSTSSRSSSTRSSSSKSSSSSSSRVKKIKK